MEQPPEQHGTLELVYSKAPENSNELIQRIKQVTSKEQQAVLITYGDHKPTTITIEGKQIPHFSAKWVPHILARAANRGEPTVIGIGGIHRFKHDLILTTLLPTLLKKNKQIIASIPTLQPDQKQDSFIQQLLAFSDR